MPRKSLLSYPLHEVLGNPHKRALYDRKHNPAASFRHVDDDDIEYRDFLRRRGTFSSRPTAFGTSARSPSFQYDEFYKQHYENMLRYNREVKKKPDYNQRMRQSQPPDSGAGMAIFGLLLSAALAIAYFVMK